MKNKKKGSISLWLYNNLGIFILIAILVYAIILKGGICTREKRNKREIQYLKRMENEKMENIK